MFHFVKNKIDVSEYNASATSGSKKLGTLVSTSNYQINAFRLAIAIAKCTFTKKPDSLYGVSEVIINILRAETLIVKSGDGRFLLDKGRIDLIRDFSKTTRIGELAQGISFLFAQDKLGIPTPFDFVGFCEYMKIPTPTGSTPDFIGSSNKGTYDLIESKGSLETKKKIITSRLNKALKQCEEGEGFLIKNGFPGAQRKFGMLTLFESYPASLPNNTAIHFFDPAQETLEEFDSWQLIVAYYKAIFLGFIGFNLSTEVELEDAEEVSIQNETFVLFRINNIREVSRSFYPVIFYTGSIRFGISKRVLRLVNKEQSNQVEYFKNIEQIKELNVRESNIETKEEMHYELFNDGTIFKFER